MKKIRNNPKIKIERTCSQETYLFYYRAKSILPKTAAGLLNGYDARNEEFHYNQYRVQKDYGRIRTAVNLKKIRTVPENQRFSSTCNLNSIDFFKWAIENHTNLKEHLHFDITRTPARNYIPSSPSILSTSNPNDTAHLIQEVSRLTKLLNEQALKILNLEETIKYLSPLAEVGSKYKKEQSQRSSKNRKNPH